MGWKLQASFQWNSLWFHSSLLGQTWEWFEWGRQPGPWLCRAAGQRSRAMAAAAGSFPTAMPALKPTKAWGYSHNLNSLAWALTPLIGFQSSGQPTASVSLCSSSNFWIHCQVIVPGLSTWMKINKSVRTTMKDPVCLCACVSVLCPLGLHAEEGEPRSICCVEHCGLVLETATRQPEAVASVAICRYHKDIKTVLLWRLVTKHLNYNNIIVDTQTMLSYDVGYKIIIHIVSLYWAYYTPKKYNVIKVNAWT